MGGTAQQAGVPGKGSIDFRRVGEIVQSPFNLETLTNGKWLALDGRDCIRGAYPELSSLFPAGVFTSTARTLAAAPQSAVIVSDSTCFLAAGASAANNLQASADGVSWTASTAWSSGSNLTSLVVAGNRFVLAGNGGNFANPWVTATGQNAAALATQANWTQALGTGGVGTTLTQGLAYSASLGRTVLCINGSLATASGLFYLNDSDGTNTWHACNGGSTQDRSAVVCTGEKFICLINGSRTIQTSTDGITWTDGYLPTGITATAPGTKIASDGNGTVVIKLGGGIGSFLVSKDHGTTWRMINLPSETGLMGSDVYTCVQYVNGKFIVGLNSPNILLSADGLSWFVDPYESRNNLLAGNNRGAFAYKAGVYCGISIQATAATYVEDMSKFRLPWAYRSATDQVASGAVGNSYIKARSNWP